MATRKRPHTTRDEDGTFGPRGTRLEGAWLELARAYGGVGALAEALGVSYPTLHRWAVQGATIPPMGRRMVGILAAQKGLPNPAE